MEDLQGKKKKKQRNKAGLDERSMTGEAIPRGL
jgi:hypothetical protein